MKSQPSKRLEILLIPLALIVIGVWLTIIGYNSAMVVALVGIYLFCSILFKY